MTFQEILKETESFTIEQQQQLAYYILFSTLNEDKKKDFMQLFNYKNKSENYTSNKYNLLDVFGDWKNKLPSDLVIEEDEFYK